MNPGPQYPFVLRARARWCRSSVLMVLTALFVLASGYGGSAFGQPGGGGVGPEQFRELDNVEGPFIDLVFAPIRPMAVTADAADLFAVNAHDSTVVHYDNSLTLQNTFPVPWGPVSIAIVEGFHDSDDELFVVCKGTHVLVRMARLTGKIKALIPLPIEPADILIDDAGARAFISCQGADAVVEVDLATNTIARQYDIPGKHPTFLSWDGDDILVAPMFSGNNTTVDKPTMLLDAGPDGIQDLAAIGVNGGLPDEDLFRIDPEAALGVAVQPVARATGTILFAHGVHPTTGQLWQLNTDANNKEEGGEPGINGTFVSNRLTIVDLPAPGEPPAGNHQIIELDDEVILPTPGDEWSPIGQPYSLAFSASGFAFVVGVLTDEATIFSDQGEPLAQWQLEGTIPRQILILDSPQGTPVFALIYYWGSNHVDAYNLTVAPVNKFAEFDLGHDPMPEKIREGRDIFFSGENSLHGNVSCNSCHVEGMWDMIAWDLAGLPTDDKGELMTQTLRGIEPLAPFHWRGERPELSDFNGAFAGLLGGAELDDEDFERFEAFVFNMANPANPNQHPDRIITGPGVQGQVEFFENPGASCAAVGCHTMPTGTNNDMVPDEGGHQDMPKRAWFKVAPFVTGVWRKEQPEILDVEIITDDSVDPPETEVITVPTLGTALSVAGVSNSIADFVGLFTGLNATEQDQIIDFVEQLDSGLAPVVHRSVLLDRGTVAATMAALTDYFMPQMKLRNCDLAAFGETLVNGELVPMRWFMDRYTGFFVAEDPLLPNRSLNDFARGVRRGESHVFLGLPVGMAERWAVDYDMDGIYNTEEEREGTDPYTRDIDPSGDTQPPELRHAQVLWNTTNIAKLVIDTDENTRYSVRYTDNVLNRTVKMSSDRFAKNHMIILKDMIPIVTYDVEILIFDAAGNLTSTVFPDMFTNQNISFGFNSAIVNDLSIIDMVAGASGEQSFKIRGELMTRISKYDEVEIPIGDFQLVATVFVNNEPVLEEIVGTPSDEADGISTINNVNLTGLVDGDEIIVSVDYCLTNNQQGPITTLFSFPDTPKHARTVTWTYPDTP